MINSLQNLSFFCFLKLLTCNHYRMETRNAKARSSHRRCSLKEGILRNFTKFAGKHLCQSLLFNKVAGLRPAALLKKRLWHRCFPVNFVKFLRTPFFQNTSGGCFHSQSYFARCSGNKRRRKQQPEECKILSWTRDALNKEKRRIKG